MRGRKTAGPELVDRLPGDAGELQRLKTILETLAGQLSVQQAAARLGLSPQRIHTLRQQALQGARAALAPRRQGRPRQTTSAEQERIDELQQELAHVQRQLAACPLVEELVECLPRRPQRGEKKRHSDQPAAAGANRRGPGRQRGAGPRGSGSATADGG